MNKPPDKPLTRESVEAAQRFAACLPALPQPQEKPPTDYERGFADHADFVKTWMREQANELYSSVNNEMPEDERISLIQREWAFRYVLQQYSQSALRKAAEAL